MAEKKGLRDISVNVEGLRESEVENVSKGVGFSELSVVANNYMGIKSYVGLRTHQKQKTENPEIF